MDSKAAKHDATLQVYAGGCFDLLHYGHANALRQARQLGSSLVVGVCSDEEIRANKRIPIVSLAKRCRLVAAIKWVDQVAPAAPYFTTLEFLDRCNCRFGTHGDDLPLNKDGSNPIQALTDAKRLLIFPRTPNISTSEIVERVSNRCASDELLTFSADAKALVDEIWFEGSVMGSKPWGNIYAYNKFGTVFPLHEDETVAADEEALSECVYIAGSFDLFHVGHLDVLESACFSGKRLVVGLYDDETARQLSATNEPPVLNLKERMLMLLAIKVVDAVVLNVPRNPIKVVDSRLNVTTVCVDKSFKDQTLLKQFLKRGVEVRFLPALAKLTDSSHTGFKTDIVASTDKSVSETTLLELSSKQELATCGGSTSLQLCCIDRATSSRHKAVSKK